MVDGEEGTTQELGDPNAPLSTLQRDGGAGALLAAAAGDVAGGNVSGTYSANTQFGVVFAYHLMRNGGMDRDALLAEVAELDGVGQAHRTYRGESADLRQWLDSASAGSAVASTAVSAGPAARALPAGLRFRGEPADLIDVTLRASRLTNLHAASTVMAVTAAGAVAGSTYHQVGLDLVLGAAETAERALDLLRGEEFRFAGMDLAAELPVRLRRLAPLVDADLREAVSELSDDNGPVGVDGVLLAILIGANKHHDPVRLIDTAAQAGGSDVGSVAGAIVGARHATTMWPWRVPNDTWFAEIGRRLVAKEEETRDLPIPYAVEERAVLNLQASPSDEN